MEGMACPPMLIASGEVRGRVCQACEAGAMRKRMRME